MKMEELKLHSQGENEHLKSLKEAFQAFKDKLKNTTDVSEKEKEIELAKVKKAFLKEKKQLKDKLF